jgi:SNF2 family DNA or RNA helicase
MSRIHNILRAIMLRRTHVDTIFNAPIVKLPGISHTTHSLEFNDVERAIYNTVKRRFIHDINKIYRAGELNGGYSNILAMIHRLRMLCSHILLCQDMLKQLFNAADIEVLWRLTAKEVEPAPANSQDTIISVLRKMIQSKSNTIKTCQSTDAHVSSTEAVESDDLEELSRGSDFGIYFKFRRFLKELSKGKAWTELHLRSMCGKCKLPPDEPICTSCFHVYCKECLSNMEYERQTKKEDKITCIECGTHFEETSPCTGLEELGFNSEEVAKRVQRVRDNRKAPENRGTFRGKSTSASPESEDEEEDIDWIELGGVTLSSAKLAATKAAILNWRERCPTEKIIVYTQFLGMVRLLGKVCKAEGWNYVQFTGKMSLTAREKAINQFAKDENISIMICTLKAGGVGLNLNMASKVIILDLWFNSSIEAQAYCRAFRIGQQRKVEVLRFVIQNSIDEDLIHMQDRKDVEVSGAIGPDSHSKRATIAQLLGLFGEVVEDGQNEFILMEDDSQVDDDDNVDIINRLPPRPF